MGIRAVFVIAITCIAVLSAEIVRYDGHKVIQVQAVTEDQLKWLAKLQNTDLDFWTYPSLVRPTDIRVSPQQFKELAGQLLANGLNYTVVHEDVQKLIESVNQHPQGTDKRQVKLIKDTVIGGFPTYENIYQWALKKKQSHSQILSLHTLGTTYEGRQQYLIKVGLNSQSGNKPIIWVDAGIHAREWISVSTVMNIINGMINGYDEKVNSVIDLLTTFDFYFVPVANPDGYVYSHTSGGRLWRKTRTRYSNGGIGSDPNRNWGYYWCVTGSSRIPSSSSYCGPYAWSEKCVVNMRDTLKSLGSKMKVYITLHSFGQMWFVPYAWSRVSYPSNYRELMSVGKSAVAAMKKTTGAVYRVGRVPDLLYEASGSSMDWVQDSLKTDYVFGMELRPARNVRNGFITSVSDIDPSAREVWAALQVVAQKAKEKLIAESKNTVIG